MAFNTRNQPDWRTVRRGASPAASVSNSLPGGHSEREPPDPIPNSEVKTLCADGSVPFRHARVGHCQAPNEKPLPGNRRGFFHLGPAGSAKRAPGPFRVEVVDLLPVSEVEPDEYGTLVTVHFATAGIDV